MDRLHYFHPGWIRPSDDTIACDLCVYGATAAGVAAAVAGARRGLHVALLNPGLHIGGLTTGGLGWTDFGNKAIVGGISRTVYQRIGAQYGVDEIWRFEPSKAQWALREMLAEAQVEVRQAQYLDAVDLDGVALRSLALLGGLRVRARTFIDATYEGDLMARAGVTYAVGREGNARYGERWNGVHVGPAHQFDCAVSPFVREGDPSSGLLPGIESAPLAAPGTGDHRVQAYNFRVCMSDDPANRVPFPRPAGYDPLRYVLAARWLAGTRDNVFAKFDRVTAHKTDTNNHGAVSSDFIGGSQGWPDGSYEVREAVFQAHVTYQQGLHWFMANDPAVPEPIRTEYARWGLAADEFGATGNWPPQLYVREARRMVGDYVVTDHDCLGDRRCEDPVGMGAYNMDSHNCQRAIMDGCVRNEGDLQKKLPEPYPISFRSIVPRAGECPNLLVPICLSASHIAFGSARMEPVFMVLGESAAIAADLALRADAAVQDVPYATLRAALLAAGQVLACAEKNTQGNPQ